MARKQFMLNTEPHVADLGGTMELAFRPEVMGDEFLDGYVQIQESYRSLGAGSEDEMDMDVDKLRGVLRDLRTFLARLMMPESREVFSRHVVVKAGKEVAVYTDPGEAEAHAKSVKGATVRDESMQLPTRVLMELLEWLAEIYGGGQRPTGSSNASASPSRPRGRRGTANSLSKG